MISALRRSFKTKFYKIILWITILATGGVFSAFEMIKLFFGSSTSRWIVRVNGKPVDYAVFTRKVADEEERLRMLRAQYGQYADLIMQMIRASSDPKVTALNAVIREALFNQAAQYLALSISNECISDKLNDVSFIQKELSDVIPMFALETSGLINARALRVYLQRSGISMEAFDDLVAKAVKRNTLEQLVLAAAYVPEFELKREFMKQYASRKISVQKISYDEILATIKKEPVAEKDLKDFFDKQNAQLKRYSIPERRSGTLLSINSSGFNIEVPAEKVEEYYQKNKGREFVESPAQIQVRRILFRADEPAKRILVKEKADKVHAELVRTPSLFAQRARELSDDKASAAQSGVLPYFSKGTREEAFERAAFVLKADNDISPVITTTAGFEILQRVGKKPISYKPLASVKSEIAEKLSRDRFIKEFNTQVRTLMQDPAVSAKSIDEFAQSKKAKRREISQLHQDSSTLAKTLFRLKEGETGYYQEGNEGHLITLKSVEKAHTPELASIKESVRRDYYADKASQTLNKKLQSLASAAQNASLSGAGIQNVGWIKKDDTQRIADLEKAGIPIKRMLQIEKIGATATNIADGYGYIARIDEIAPFNRELFDKEKGRLKSELVTQRSGLLTAGFVASLWRFATIDKNESLLHLES